MKIESKLTLPNKVLALVKKALAGHPGTLSLEAYQNGRETGHALTVYVGGYAWTVVYANDRRSDMVVVYTGGSFGKCGLSFGMAGNVPSEEIYQNRRTFPTAAGAAAFVAEFIQNPK